ncbi:MAG TPA: AraC family transcriptional regulator, partial [Blastocatellia bacterium]|nr:AraC family transcriptional regulator [Blastocatellia bacterium]
MHEKARFHHWQGTGSLSIKSFRSGRALYNAGRGCYAVDQNSYLVLNHGQRYSITVDSDKSVESFCIFFQAGLSGDVFRSLTSNPVTLLDNPYPPRPKELTFFERTYPHDDVLSPALFHLRDALGNLKEEPFRRDELLHGVMERLLVAHCRVYKEIAALESARAATREELYRRAHRARDFILACFDRTLTLGEIAA